MVMTIMMNISGGARFVLAAALLNSSVRARLVDECDSDSTCELCVDTAVTNLINPFAPSKPCEYVENGGWDSDLQKCIEDSCSLDDGCVEELQKWINASTVCYRKTFKPNSFLGFDYELFYGNRLPCYEGVVCNKAGGNEAVNFNYEKRCDVYNPPKSNNGGVTWFGYTDVMTGKAFSANCVDVDDPSLTTAICINEDDCSAHGKFSPKPSSSGSGYTLYNEDDEEEEEEEEEEEPVVAEESDKENVSPAEAITGNVGIFLSTSSLLYYAWL